MENNKLAKELWESVESSEGYAFISDGIIGKDLSDEQIIEIAINAREWNKETNRILTKFINKHIRGVGIPGVYTTK